ncbi:MAG: hypothetical protein ACE5F9_15165 [Phycisphaerae bacterium]
MGILTPALGAARARSRSVSCASHLRSVGQLIHAFANAHDENVAAIVRERDYRWDRGEQAGWDIEVGRWAGTPGGPRSVWHCPQSDLPFVGNARALGLDNRRTLVGGLLHRVGPRLWSDASRLVLAYDARDDQPIFPLGPGSAGATTVADYPFLGDVSDEQDGNWPRDGRREYLAFLPGDAGPHPDGSFGVSFADGHAAVDRFADAAEAVFWSGPRWWADEVIPLPYQP